MKLLDYFFHFNNSAIKGAFDMRLVIGWQWDLQSSPPRVIVQLSTGEKVGIERVDFELLHLKLGSIDADGATVKKYRKLAREGTTIL